MPIRRARWVILGEGLQDLNFAYHWLRARNVPRGTIEKRVPLAGRCSGEQHVRAQLPIELARLRSRAGEAIVLIVITDADSLTVEQRVATLDDAVAHDRERVVLLIPRRNLETWIAYFHGHAVDESTDYKQRFRDSDMCRAAARRLAALTELPADAPDSLRRAFGELARLRLP